MFQNIIRVLGGDPNKRELQRTAETVTEINAQEAEYEKLSDEALLAKTAEFRQRLTEGEELDDLLPEAFAAVREAGKRTIGLRHYDVQMIGGITLHQGKIAEMRTGEGKTLVATLPLYLNAIEGKGTHLVTVNDYLARRDARWMAPIYNALGLTVGVLQMASRTENGQLAFLIDPEKTSPHEDQNQLRLVPRKEAYLADITYGTNSEFGFDYLRDNTTMRLEDRVQRGHNYAIVDEVDNILIDEARTPLIISGPASEDTEWYVRTAQAARQLNPEDFEVEEKDHTVTLTEIGEMHIEQILGTTLRDPDRPEDITPEQARLMGYMEQSLRAQYLYKRNKDYLVQGGKVVIVDEFTGRLMPGRRWSDGLHQAVEAKEGVKIEPENVTYATITLQNYFRMYKKLAGMTGTALTEAEEFSKIYKLEVLPIPTNLEYQATFSPEGGLIEVPAKDEKGYKYNYYAHKDDPDKKAVYWRRKDYPDVVYRTFEGKTRAITTEIVHFYVMGRPQLVGTTSVEHSQNLSYRLHAESVKRLMQCMLIRTIWFEKHTDKSLEQEIPELSILNIPVEDLDIGKMRQLARDLNISFNPEDPENLTKLIEILELRPQDKDRLLAVLQAGVPHQVLNAKKHDEESKIIAQAGAFGAVTIATNMAGRGVDIKLGGDLNEGILNDVNRILKRAGVADPYDLTMEERHAALLKVPSEDYGIYEGGIQMFLEYMDNMELVRELGGLHVIGSERHEARRIDNQLRGRAARQGDPGSSRFYLSLQDELMRLFGGGQVEGLMERLHFDESIPIESGMVGRLVEQSQTRVEGSNFDIRKHLLEYDDVLNTQRARIYGQRDMIFTKEDLSEDVIEMLKTELSRRIPEAMKDEEGPWKLLAYLEDVQPPIFYDNDFYPNYTQRILLEKIDLNNGREYLRQQLLDLAEKAHDVEQSHLMDGAKELIDKSEETLNSQVAEREDTLDTWLDGMADQEDLAQRRPQEVLDELIGLLRLPIRLNNEQMRRLVGDPKSLSEEIKDQIHGILTGMTVTRLVAAFERRLEEGLSMKPAQYQQADWDSIAGDMMQELDMLFQKNRDKLFGTNGQVARELDSVFEKLADKPITENLVAQLLGYMSQGARMVFDQKTHRQVWQRTTRLRYVFLAAQMLAEHDAQYVTADILEHLDGAREAMLELWGSAEWARIRQAEGSFNEMFLAKLAAEIGQEKTDALAARPLAEWDADVLPVVRKLLGSNVMGGIYRQLLLSVISELWVDYLTRVEALRVSIGLEAYAQRDPLVQYKGQASELFGQLLSDIRAGALSRMFNYRPRLAASAAEEQPQSESAPAAVPSAPVPEPSAAPGDTSGGKKKRHRH
jgi:preprotein translocase subunit SecA